jgi:hypothetical protein
MGITLLGPAWHDMKLCTLAERFETTTESVRPAAPTEA